MKKGLFKINAKAKGQGQHPTSRSVIEALENRLLFSADLAPISVSIAGPDATSQAVQALNNAQTTHSPTQNAASHQVYVVDSRIANAQVLINGLQQQQALTRAGGETFDLLVIEQNEDGLAKISEFLNGENDITALHIISHGQNGMMLLGNSWLDDSAMRSRSLEISTWGNALTPESDILLYGCDFAASNSGQNIVRNLAQLTGADVAASIDATGNASLQANWDFEFRQGIVAADAGTVQSAATNWQGSLLTYVVTNTNNAGAGSLRQAILDANANVGTDLITFNITAPLVNGAHTISLSAKLPDVDDTVTIDGDTQPDSVTEMHPTVVITGNGNYTGLILANGSAGSMVAGLVVNNFSDGIEVLSDNVIIRHNIIGLNALGTVSAGNTNTGIFISGNNTLIGGSSAADRNIISGNQSDGLFISSAVGTKIQRNYIGLGLDGETALRNGDTGFGSGIYITNSSGSLIGGSALGEGNYISANAEVGVLILGNNSATNQIKGNKIGLSVSGQSRGNGLSGVQLSSGAHDNFVGGINAADANIIANSGATFLAAGIRIDSTSGSGNSVFRNSIYASSGLGIDTAAAGVTTSGLPIISGAFNNGSQAVVRGSFVGTANQNYRLEFFESSSAQLDPSGYGEGPVFVGAIDLAANAAGNPTLFDTQLSAIVPTGRYISATLTNTSVGGSSEFSAAIAVQPVNLVLNYPGVIAVSESGTSATITVKLTSAPNANVRIPVSLTDFSEGFLSTSQLNFDAANWNIAQTITVTGQSDNLLDGNVTYWVELGAAQSTDTLFNGMSGYTFAAVTTDINTYNTIVVDTDVDAADGDTSSIAALTASRGADGLVSLREAIIAANNTPNSVLSQDHISFNLTGPTTAGMHVIRLVADLPVITGATTIDGSTAPDYLGTPTVRIDGGGTSKGFDFQAGANYSVINALAITGMKFSGIDIATSNVVVTRNFIGTTGTAAAGNQTVGIGIYGAFNEIGRANAGNVISGNLNSGVFINGAAATRNKVVGNFIGTDATGTVAVANGRDGVLLSDAGIQNTIGASVVDQRNIISGNVWCGIELVGTTAQTDILNNYIGTDVSGMFAISNGQSGICLWNGAANNFIGRSGAGNGNLISGNVGNGILLSGDLRSSNTNTIENNFVGVNAAGDTALPNQRRGISIENAQGTLIGGLTQASRNIVSGNALENIYLFMQADTTTIQGNFIGLNALGNDKVNLGNSSNGIGIEGATNTQIGGTQIGAANYIGGNTNVANLADGIYVNGGVNTTIEGNYIGIGLDGVTEVPNFHGGIVLNNTSNARVGGTLRESSNRIANNQVGVRVAGSSNNVAILGNQIYANLLLGIDLAPSVNGDSVTGNDLGDADTGANGYQNFPIIDSAVLSQTSLLISGALNSNANTNYRIEFFANALLDAGNSQGRILLGSADVATDNFGNARFTNLQLPINGLQPQQAISATATEILSNSQFGGTSELSSAVQILAPTSAINVSTISNRVSEAGTTATFSVVLASQPIADVSIALSPSLLGEVRLDKNLLVFNATNWNLPQVVVITGIQDFINDGSTNLTIITAAATSTDIAYNGLNANDVLVSNDAIENTPPIISAPTSINTDEDVAVALAGVRVADADSGDAPLRVTLSANQGLISLKSITGLSFSMGDGSADGVMEFTASINDINAALDNLVFLPSANFFGVANVTIAIDDLGASGFGSSKVSTQSVAVNVTSVNDRPTLTGTSGASIAQASEVFLTSAMLALGDVDNLPSELIFTIDTDATQGKLFFGETALRIGDSFRQSDLNASLIKYVHNGSEFGTDSLALGLSDSFGGTLPSTIFEITVTAVYVPNVFSLMPTVLPSMLGTSVQSTVLDNAIKFGPQSESYVEVAIVNDAFSTLNDLGLAIANTSLSTFTSLNALIVLNNDSAPAAVLKRAIYKQNSNGRYQRERLEIVQSSSKPIALKLSIFDKNKQASDSLMIENIDAFMEQKQLAAYSIETLIASFGSDQKNQSWKPIAVIQTNFDLPDIVQAGSIKLSDIEKSIAERRHDAIIEGLQAGGVVISTGLMGWVARVGGLVTALITALPAWKSLDPLLVLATSEDQNMHEDKDFSDTNIRLDEEAVDAVLF